MTSARTLLLGILLAGLAGAATAQVPSPLHGVTVSAVVARDSTTGIFTYRYRVVNPASNAGPSAVLPSRSLARRARRTRAASGS